MERRWSFMGCRCTLSTRKFDRIARVSGWVYPFVLHSACWLESPVIQYNPMGTFNLIRRLFQEQPPLSP